MRLGTWRILVLCTNDCCSPQLSSVDMELSGWLAPYPHILISLPCRASAGISGGCRSRISPTKPGSEGPAWHCRPASCAPVVPGGIKCSVMTEAGLHLHTSQITDDTLLTARGPAIDFEAIVSSVQIKGANLR